MLSVRQVTGLLQQYDAESASQDGVLQYPNLLDMLCRCALLLRQQVQRKLSGPWVNVTEVALQNIPLLPIIAHACVGVAAHLRGSKHITSLGPVT